MSDRLTSQADSGVRAASVQTRADKRTRLEDVATLVKDGDTVWLVPTWEPMIVKAMRRSLEFWMIFGWAEVMLKSCALP